MLPLATYYTSVEASMDSRNTTEYGMVSHALCSGIRSMLKVGTPWTGLRGMQLMTV